MSRAPVKVAPREAQVSDLIQDIQCNGRPHPLRPLRRVVSAGPKRLIVEHVSGLLRGQREYVERADLERLGPKVRCVLREHSKGGEG